ncbi:uncharacterized protein LOC122646213 [Telopea speciosissima]|uniref:uncharacterized protein LOC122646213 n=1 Tax=Telopea speciosissima TaxID=54955 RepID=UPI001CC6D057|nr:uncharacterized protein LOC122646213 [Telopea speciosissima]
MPPHEDRPAETRLGGPPEGSRPSFSSVVSQSLAPPVVQIELKKPASFYGVPVVFFSKEEVALSERAFTSLIAKCSYGRPTLFVIKEFLQKRFFLQGDVVVLVLDRRHVLLHFLIAFDFVKTWLKEQAHIQGYLLRFMRWTSNFTPGWESPLSPVWVSMPGLPVNFYQGNFLASITGSIGRVLKVDGATVSCTRTVAAGVCVEVDLRASLPSQVWVGCGSGGFHQKIVFERLPAYCCICSKIGHDKEVCRKALKTSSKFSGHAPQGVPKEFRGLLLARGWLLR